MEQLQRVCIDRVASSNEAMQFVQLGASGVTVSLQDIGDDDKRVLSWTQISAILSLLPGMVHVELPFNFSSEQLDELVHARPVEVHVLSHHSDEERLHRLRGLFPLRVSGLELDCDDDPESLAEEIARFGTLGVKRFQVELCPDVAWSLADHDALLEMAVSLQRLCRPNELIFSVQGGATNLGLHRRLASAWEISARIGTGTGRGRWNMANAADAELLTAALTRSEP